MTLLDIIIDPNDSLFRSHSETPVPAPEPEVPYSVIPTETMDTITVTSDVITGKQQLADIAPDPTETVGMVSDNLLLTIIVVLVALCLCFYFVWKYRKNNG